MQKNLSTGICSSNVTDVNFQTSADADPRLLTSADLDLLKSGQNQYIDIFEFQNIFSNYHELHLRRLKIEQNEIYLEIYKIFIQKYKYTKCKMLIQLES